VLFLKYLTHMPVAEIGWRKTSKIAFRATLTYWLL
jgi:hypothetical protein